MTEGSGREGPRLRDLVLFTLSIAGLALCITLVFLGMRAVMDIGGACAEGGPYVPRQGCPDGATAALMLGIFGLFGAGGAAMVFGARVGGRWAGAGFLAWTGLFASLGWNFLDYGLFNTPGDEGVIWGWLIPGILFQVMAWAPLVLGTGLLSAMSSGHGAGGGARRGPVPMPGPGQSPRGASAAGAGLAGAAGTGVAGAEPAGADAAGAPSASFTRVVVNGQTLEGEAAREALQDVAEAISAATMRAVGSMPLGEILDAVASRPVPVGGTPVPGEVPGASSAAVAQAGAAADVAEATDPEAPFSEGTQALLDRLERLADMRAQNLLDAAEYETAKDAVLRELEARKQ